MVTIYNTTLSATSQRHFSDSLGGGRCSRQALLEPDGQGTSARYAPVGAIPPTPSARAPPVHEATGGYAVRSPLTIRLYCKWLSVSSMQDKKPEKIIPFKRIVSKQFVSCER